ncbi:MAG: cysteine hydrolase [Veillonellaceae bacterium]|nr:cysteine hydrolase [Veillonellaceae bacterium]
MKEKQTKRALIVVDMLNDFIAPDGALSCGPAGEAIVPACAAHVAAHREAGDTVIYVCDRHRPDDAEFRMFPPHCIAGTPGAEIIAELAPAAGDIVISKRRYSGFFGTGLDLDLRELGITELFLVGVCTNICVQYTAADARNRGYEVHVYRDAVASFDEAAHTMALSQMESVLGCTVE